MTQAQFISIEGIEGVGKSTARGYIESMLQKQEIDYIVTREPGGTTLAESIRSLLLEEHQEVVHCETELLLMFAARIQNVKNVIEPALKAGRWVLADRFVDASVAYQGGGRGIDVRAIEGLSQWVLGSVRPNLTLLLDAPVEVGFDRVQKRGHKDRIEQEEQAFFERVRQQYLHLAQNDRARFRVIDATLPLNEVQRKIDAVLAPYVQGATQ